MSDLLRERPDGRLPSPAFNPFLLFFALLLAGVPFSYFYEVITNPFAREAGYWADINTDAHLPFAVIKSARQSGGLWREFDAKNPGKAIVATATLPRPVLHRDSTPVRRALPAIFRERP